MGATLPPAYFDALYRDNPDPWGFVDSDYERGKYAATLAALPRSTYRSGLEVGCSIGVLTALLAARCEALLGIDVSAQALADARARTAGGVAFAQMHFPEERPTGSYDLILLSEVLYYFDPPTLADAAEATADLAVAGADILLVHWLGPTPDYPLTGEAAATAFIAAIAPWATLQAQWRAPDYRIDRLQRRPDPALA